MTKMMRVHTMKMLARAPRSSILWKPKVIFVVGGFLER